jgi:phenylalanyl-tRNA synthetase beta chain
VITYPANLQDIAVVVDEDVTAGDLVAAIREAGGPELRTARVFDVYAGDQVADGRKSVAVHLAFQSPERTLSDAEVAELRQRIVATLSERFQAELRG